MPLLTRGQAVRFCADVRADRYDERYGRGPLWEDIGEVVLPDGGSLNEGLVRAGLRGGIGGMRLTMPRWPSLKQRQSSQAWPVG